jgi:hypothetical protein
MVGHKERGKVILPQAFVGKSKFIEPSRPSPVGTVEVESAMFPLSRQRFYLAGQTLSMTAANDFGSLQLCDFANSNLLIAGAMIAIEKGSADAFASDRGILIGLAVTSKDPSRFALPSIIFSYEPYGFMVRRNDAAFRLAVNRSLAEIYRSGNIGPIYERWFGAFGKPSPAILSMYLLNGLPE